jgi:hypothetical protein
MPEQAVVHEPVHHHPNHEGDPVPMTAEADPHPNGEAMTDDEAQADTQRSLTPEDIARARLNGLACQLGPDEMRVLTRIAQRLRGGQEAARLAHRTEARKRRGREAREELEDALVSLACAWLNTESTEVG